MVTHSPVGGSGMHRWGKCPGSVLIGELFPEPEGPDKAYRAEGDAAHEAIATALRTGADAWEFVGTTINSDQAPGVQTFLDKCRRLVAIEPGGEVYIEQEFRGPKVHPLFFGRPDFVYVVENRLYLFDYKSGAGIAVKSKSNDQLLYYAFGLSLMFSDVDDFGLEIVQTNIPGHDPGHMSITRTELSEWAETSLKPKIERTLKSAELVPGEHCRFCPGKLACRALRQTFLDMSVAPPPDANKLSDTELAEIATKIPLVRMAIQAIEDAIYGRMIYEGRVIPGMKYVAVKADRVWKDGVEAEAVAVFGADAMTEPQLKSPAQFEKLGSTAAEFTKRHAFTPNKGITVAPLSDRRMAVEYRHTPAAEVFGHLLAAE